MRKNITILVSLLILSHTACSDKGQYFEESGSVFHTSYHIKYKAKQILTDNNRLIKLIYVKGEIKKDAIRDCDIA